MKVGEKDFPPASANRQIIAATLDGLFYTPVLTGFSYLVTNMNNPYIIKLAPTIATLLYFVSSTYFYGKTLGKN